MCIMVSSFGQIVVLALALIGTGKAETCPTKGSVLLQRGRSLSQLQILPDLSMPSTIYFDAVIRDFRADHPDMQFFDGHSEGLVHDTLGGDKKPIYSGGPQLSNKTNFDQWYNDVPGVNKRMDFKMDMRLTEEGTYVHENASFFPIDGQGWGDFAIALDGLPHNFYFTLELHTTFVYQGGESFTFRGDDDVWVFINKKLVIDLGGVHNPLERTVNLDDLNLTAGSAGELSFFFAERRCCGSEFRIETTIRPVTGTCTVWGDPHIDVFDSGLFGREKTAPVAIYNSGDFWLVKNEFIKIQGRYGTTQYSPTQSALLGLAIGGSFLRNKTLIVGPMDDGMVTWDGEEILKDFPSEFVLDGFMSVFFRAGIKHIDAVLSGYPIKMIRALLPRNIILTVNRWPKHIDVIIRMPQQLGGQDGHCGNFDLDVSDDTQELVQERMGAPVAPEELLFRETATVGGSDTFALSQPVSLSDCSPFVKASALEHCQKAGAHGLLLDSCVFDVCFGGKEFAAEDVITEEEAAEQESQQ